MKLRRSRRRLAVIGAVTALSLAGAGAAFAYFTSTGNGTGSGTVGTATPWNVVQTSTNGISLYPCSSSCTSVTETITFTVTNNGSGAQQLTAATPSVDHDGSGNVYSGGTLGNAVADPPVGAIAITGCLASWFTVSDSGFTAVDVPAGGTTTVVVSVVLTDSGTNQDSCESTSPDVYLGVS